MVVHKREAALALCARRSSSRDTHAILWANHHIVALRRRRRKKSRSGDVRAPNCLNVISFFIGINVARRIYRIQYWPRAVKLVK